MRGNKFIKNIFYKCLQRTLRYTNMFVTSVNASIWSSMTWGTEDKEIWAALRKLTT